MSAGDDLSVVHPRPFKRLTVDAYFNRITDNRVLVEWAMDKAFIAPGPYTFVLYRGYAINDDAWTAVAETVDQPWAYDVAPVFPQMGTEVYYRVIMTDGEGQTYTSQAVSVGVYWNQYDWSLAKEIIRKEHLVLRKRAGTKGWLMKRREWGDPCVGCVDPATGQIIDTSGACALCYGTGIVGGYYTPVEYWVIMNPTQRLAKLDADQGLLIQNVETVRALAYPTPSSLDVWIHGNTDQRFLVMNDIAAIARHRGIDLVLNIRLEERGRNDPIYLVPVPCA